MRVAYLTHGCRLNQFETDAVQARFAAAGHETVEDPDLTTVWTIVEPPPT